METKIAMILIIIALAFVTLISAVIKLFIDLMCEKEIEKGCDKFMRYVKLREKIDDLNEKDALSCYLDVGDNKK